MIYYFKTFLRLIFIFLYISCNSNNYTAEKDLMGPEHFINEIKNGRVQFNNKNQIDIASKRWEIAIEGAKNANRPIPILNSIKADSTALLVIDMQRVFLDEGAAIEVPEGRKIITNINKLANSIRDKGGMVFWFRYIVDDDIGLLKYFESESYLGGNRISPLEAMKESNKYFELHPSLDIKENDIVINKNRYSAVHGSNIVDVLRENNIKNVIVTGVTTDVCAGNTAESLMQKDFYIVMVWDGTATLSRLEHELYLARIYGLYGDVMGTEEIIRRFN